MKTLSLSLLASIAAAPLLAEETRELDAHVHGVTEVRIAVEGGEVEITLHAPGMDIVGFEHEAVSDEDKAAVEDALARLEQAGSVVALDPAAECVLEDAEAELHGGDAGHDDHEDHEAEGRDEADHDEEAEGRHTEFEAHYHFECGSPQSLTTVAFPFFESFPNAEEIEAEFVTEAGAGAKEIARDAPELTLK